MRILYHSMTGNVRRFLAKTGFPCGSIEVEKTVDEPFVLVTNTIGFGEVPAETAAFLERNGRFLCGVAASGNRNWGKNFAKAADRIAAAYCVPVICKFELGGTDADVLQFRERVKAIAEQRDEVKVLY